MRPFEVKRGKAPRVVRRVNQFRFKKAAKLRDNIGVLQTKKVLRSCFLNVDGLSAVTLEDVRNTVLQKKPDIVFLVETMRRSEETCIDIELAGYSLSETRRSNMANDKDGGGIALYTKLSDGILFKAHTPDIASPDAAFVARERMWVTVESQTCKTAFCGLYLGCQYGDDRNSAWNQTIYQTVQQESFSLRSKGFRVVYLGDFNGHVGSILGEGVPGNKPGVNPNGRKFMDFLKHTDSVHINGACRTPGSWETRMTSGLWTRQRGGFSSIIDFGVISSEHLGSVISMEVDDQGRYGTISDHNWLFLDMTDNFVKQKRISNLPVKKSHWDIKKRIKIGQDSGNKLWILFHHWIQVLLTTWHLLFLLLFSLLYIQILV